MNSSLRRLLGELGMGRMVQTTSGETLFKLDSYHGNPIIKPQEIGLTWRDKGAMRIGAVFNGGATQYEGEVILTPRCHYKYKKSWFFDDELGIKKPCFKDYISEIQVLVSGDGVHFNRFHDVIIRGDGTDHQDFIYGVEDIRIVRYDRRYLLIGCGKIKPPFTGGNADRIAIYSTDDFLTINYHGIIEAFDSRNAVPFMEPVDDRHAILLRFHPNIHLVTLEAGLDQLLNPSQHRKLWRTAYKRRRQNLLLEAGHYPHEKEKIGPGPPVIKTDRGWLLIYHSVGEIDDVICREYGLDKRIRRGYSICAALLDLDHPEEILCRTGNPIYIPSAPYELYGDHQYPVDVPAVVFPTGVMRLEDRLVIYSGAGDKYVILLSCDLNYLVDYLLDSCSVNE